MSRNVDKEIDKEAKLFICFDSKYAKYYDDWFLGARTDAEFIGLEAARLAIIYLSDSIKYWNGKNIYDIEEAVVRIGMLEARHPDLGHMLFSMTGYMGMPIMPNVTEYHKTIVNYLNGYEDLSQIVAVDSEGNMLVIAQRDTPSIDMSFILNVINIDELVRMTEEQGN